MLLKSRAINNELLCMSWASSPPRQPRQLPWWIFETMINYKKWPKELGRFEEKNLYFFPSIKKNSLDNKYPWSSLQIWRNKYLFYSTKQKTSLNILGLLCRIEEIDIFIILPSIKNSLNILGPLCKIEKKCAKDHLKKPSWISWV